MGTALEERDTITQSFFISRKGDEIDDYGKFLEQTTEIILFKPNAGTLSL